MLKVAVLGLGRFGSSVALGLARAGAEVLAIDRRTSLVEAVADEVAVAVGFDATEMPNLKAYGIGSMDVCVVAIGNNFEASVQVVMHCRALGVKRIIAKSLNSMQESVLRQLGADQIIKPEEDMGARLAEHLMHDSVVDFVELPAGFSLRRIPVPAEWQDKSLRELDLLGSRRLNVIQIHRLQSSTVATGAKPASEKIALPGGDQILQAGDQVDVIGTDRELDRIGEV
jgi:trk system potassium uptake protein TrkA